MQTHCHFAFFIFHFFVRFFLSLMNIITRLDQYDDACIYFCEAIKNNIMNEGKFIRIIYSTQHCALNGVYLFIDLVDISCDKFYNKFKCTFGVEANKETVCRIKCIEEELLKKIDISHKMPQFKIYEQLRNGNIKLFSDVAEEHPRTCSLILKISGVWETQFNYGLTYKFVKVTRRIETTL